LERNAPGEVVGVGCVFMMLKKNLKNFCNNIIFNRNTNAILYELQKIQIGDIRPCNFIYRSFCWWFIGWLIGDSCLLTDYNQWDVGH